jgi:hypothetical protein
VRFLSNNVSVPDTTYSPQSVLVCLGTDTNACSQYALGSAMWVHPSFTSATPFPQRVDLTVLKLQVCGSLWLFVFPHFILFRLLLLPLLRLDRLHSPLRQAVRQDARAQVIQFFFACWFFGEGVTKRQGASYIVSGFGDQSSDPSGSSNPSSVLKYAQQTFVAPATCQSAAGFTIPVQCVCTGPVAGQSGTDSCQGDVRDKEQKEKRKRFVCCSDHVVAVWGSSGCACRGRVLAGGGGADGHVDGRNAGKEARDAKKKHIVVLN